MSNGNRKTKYEGFHWFLVSVSPLYMLHSLICFCCPTLSCCLFFFYPAVSFLFSQMTSINISHVISNCEGLLIRKRWVKLEGKSVEHCTFLSYHWYLPPAIWLLCYKSEGHAILLICVLCHPIIHWLLILKRIFDFNEQCLWLQILMSWCYWGSPRKNMYENEELQ